MENTETEVRKLKELKKGDIIRMRVPFEENTPDYYNGYNPKEIRGHMYKDRFGQTSKARFVVVVGRDEKNVMYLPLTSRHSRFDSKHQYTLQDNSMTWRKDEDMRSYVEVDSLRAMYVKEDWDIHYIGRVAENDMVNIMVKLGEREIDFGSKRDQRAYVSRRKEASFERSLEQNGYEMADEAFAGKTYIKPDDGSTVTKSRWGLVMYHVPLSKEEVAQMVAVREQKPVDEFTRGVTYITEKSASAEREAI